MQIECLFPFRIAVRPHVASITHSGGNREKMMYPSLIGVTGALVRCRVRDSNPHVLSDRCV